MSDEGIANYCFECKQPLTEIDNRGRRLWGCMNCNIWWSLRGASPRCRHRRFSGRGGNEAKFVNGVLTIKLPKSAEAQKNEKRIAIKKG